MMAKKNRVVISSPAKIKDIFDDIIAERVVNKLDRAKDLTERELMRMMMSTNNFKNVLSEMKTKQRRKG